MENSLLYKPLAHQNKNLQPSEDGEQDEFLSHRPQTRKNTGRSCFLYCTISILILIAYSVLLVIWTQSLAKHNRRYGTRFSASETPADDFIFYETREMEQWEGGMDGAANEYFTTPPNEEVDKNWHNLMEKQNIGLPGSFIKQLGREDETIKLPDGTYYGSLMVFHHLHCLKNIYHALNPEYYGLVNLTDEEKESLKDHTNHCLHLLREAIMCQGDTTIITMMFANYSLRPIGNFTSPHECVNWPRLLEWVNPNSRDLTKEGWLMHPKYGPVVVDGHLGNGPI